MHYTEEMRQRAFARIAAWRETEDVDRVFDEYIRTTFQAFLRRIYREFHGGENAPR